MKFRPLLMLGLALVFAGLLSACASAPEVRWAQGQQAYNDTMRMLISYRMPCVPGSGVLDAGPAHPGCLIDDEAALKINMIKNAADISLRQMAAAAGRGDVDRYETLLTQFEGLLMQLVLTRREAERMANPAPG
jgi:hypothetical protein